METSSSPAEMGPPSHTWPGSKVSLSRGTASVQGIHSPDTNVHIITQLSPVINCDLIVTHIYRKNIIATILFKQLNDDNPVLPCGHKMLQLQGRETLEI